MTSPPQEVIDCAMVAAMQSPCAKSKRGVVIYDPRDNRIYGAGNNRQPDPFACLQNDACREHCAKLCNHAEQIAIVRAMSYSNHRPPMHLLTLLHVKVRDGQLVADPDDYPSCWQCSRLIVEVGLAGVWLYEDLDTDPAAEWARWFRGDPERQRDPTKFGWLHYSATEFHAATQRNCGLPNTLRSTT